VVAQCADVPSVGIDVERNRAFEPGLIRRIATPVEQAQLQKLQDASQRAPGDRPARKAEHEVNWPAVLFSAKESIFKAWFPLTRRWLGLLDVDVHIDPAHATFATRVDTVEIDGRYCASAEHIFTVAIARRIPVPRQTPVASQTPLAREAAITRQSPIARQTRTTTATPIARQTPVGRQTPITRETPVARQTQGESRMERR
jgi:phosphopantetheinyl transferase (holo-ACP synthase)